MLECYLTCTSLSTPINSLYFELGLEKRRRTHMITLALLSYVSFPLLNHPITLILCGIPITKVRHALFPLTNDISFITFCGKYSSFKICKTPSARLVVEYLGCRPQRVGFQVPALIRTAQARPSEAREKNKLN